MTSRILVVDDNAINLKLACDLLESEGFEVDRACDGQSALARLGETIPDLVLMDIGLPDVDGLTLTRRLKADPQLRSIPVVALTAFAMKGDEQRALDAGCDGYITKPIDTRTFSDTVRRHLPGADASKLPTLSVLVIEDDPVDRKLIQLVLTGDERSIRSRPDADGVLQAVRESPPDVILLDMRLPGLDGLALLRSLKADPVTREIPVVTVTAYPLDYDSERLTAAGCDLCIVKPIDTRTLPGILDALARKRRK